MAPKKNRKQPQGSMLEEPVEDQVAPLESIGEEEPRLREDQDEPESEEEPRSSVLFTQKQLEVFLKMGRPDFGELVAVLKTGAAKGERFQPAKPENFDGARDRKVVDAWLAEMDDYLHATKVGRHSAVELAQSYLKDYAATWWRTVRQKEGKNHGYTWEFFKDRIEAEFISKNSDYIPRCKLRDLVNATNENLRQYVRAYSELMLEVRHMHEMDEFGVMEVDFLGHRITQEGLMMDDHKVKAILDWEPPKSVPALKSFLGLASHYRKFIKNFAKIAAPLTNLLKKSAVIYDWDEACDEAFGTLKGILVKAPVLKLPNFDKDFEIHSDTSNFAIGGVIVQEGRPVAFESKKLSETERRWPTHEKEMWAVIHCLKTCGHYIGSKDVMVWTDNVTLKYFSTQPKLSSKQVRWQDTLALFNVDIRHKPGKKNIIPDALSRKHQLRVVYVGESELQKEIRLANRRNAFAKEARQSIQNGAKSHFHLRNGLLWYKQNRLYVPEGKIRDTLLKECHDGPLAGHGG